MSHQMDNFDCLFVDFGEPVLIDRTNEVVIIKHDTLESLHDLSLAQYKSCSGVGYIQIADNARINLKDCLTLQNTGQQFRVEHKVVQGGLVKLILSDQIKETVDDLCFEV